MRERKGGSSGSRTFLPLGLHWQIPYYLKVIRADNGHAEGNSADMTMVLSNFLLVDANR